MNVGGARYYPEGQWMSVDEARRRVESARAFRRPHFVDLLVIIGAIADTVTGDEGLAGGIASIVVLVLIGVGMVAAARSIEHHLRYRIQPQRTTDPNARARFRRSRPNRKVEIVVSVLALTGLAIFTPFWTAQSWSRWRTSVETQDHGVVSTVTVQRVVRVFHDEGRGGGYYTVHLQGSLAPPVGGRTETTVYIPNDGGYSDQEQVPVLVDPRDPAHAERPGLEDYSYAGIVGIVGLAIALDLALVLIVAGVISRFRRSRNRSRVGAAAAR